MNKTITFSMLLLLASLFAKSQNAEHTINRAHASAITCLAATFDANVVVSGGADSRANVWDLKSGSKLRALAAQNDTITDVVYNNDETYFATASKNKTIAIWDASTYKPKRILNAPNAILGISFHPFQNNLLSIDNHGKLALWDALAGKPLNENLASVEMGKSANAAIKWSTDGSAFVLGISDKVFVFSATGALRSTLDAAPGARNPAEFDISPDSKLLAVKISSNQISIINLSDGKVTQQIAGDYGHMSGLQFVQNSNALLQINDGGQIDLYNLVTQKRTQVANVHTDIVRAQVSADGNSLVVASNDAAIRKLDVTKMLFGTREYPSPGSPKLLINGAQLIDENKNGLLDGGEKASIEITLSNKGGLALYGVRITLASNNPITGLEFPSEILAGNMEAGATKTITVPLKVGTTIAGNAVNLKIAVSSGSKILANDQMALQIGSSQNAGVIVKSFNFYSPSGKVSKGEPITLVLQLENVTRIIAENVQIKYKVPAGIRPIDKTTETIAKIAAGTTVQVSMQFIADKEFNKDSIQIALNISGVAYTNSGNAIIAAVMGKTIAKQDDIAADNNQQGVANRGIEVVSQTGSDNVKPIEESKFVALVIGINEYSGSWPRLSNAVNDAKAVEETLKSQYGFSTVRSLYDKDATRQKIISELEWLVGHVGENDNLVIFYSGHGDFKPTLNKGFWVPVDAGSNSTSYLISNPDIQTFLSSIPARHTLLISDACFSGDILRSGTAPPAEINTKYYNRVYSLMSRQAITSGGIEPVMDGGRDNHSVFTYYLLKALKENRQKFFDAAQLFDNIKIPIVNNSSQAPKFSPLKNTGDAGGEFVFMKK